MKQPAQGNYVVVISAFILDTSNSTETYCVGILWPDLNFFLTLVHYQIFYITLQKCINHTLIDNEVSAFI